MRTYLRGFFTITGRVILLLLCLVVSNCMSAGDAAERAKAAWENVAQSDIMRVYSSSPCPPYHRYIWGGKGFVADWASAGPQEIQEVAAHLDAKLQRDYGVGIVPASGNSAGERLSISFAIRDAHIVLDLQVRESREVRTRGHRREMRTVTVARGGAVGIGYDHWKNFPQKEKDSSLARLVSAAVDTMCRQ